MPTNGGPAFGHGSENGHCCGMTLRDYFAAAALSYLVANKTREAAATIAYEYADAMLKAREARDA